MTAAPYLAPVSREATGFPATGSRKEGISIHGPLNVPFWRAPFSTMGGVPENSPLALMGRLPSLMARFPTLHGKQPIKKRPLRGSWSLPDYTAREKGKIGR